MRKRLQKSKKAPMRGGGDGYMPGVEINSIAEFSPLNIPGLILWVKADPTKLVTSSIQDYTQNLSPSIANHILDQYKTNPTEVVVVEITSDVPGLPNSLVRLELDTESAVGFPKFRTQPGALDVIDMSNLLDPASKEKQIYKLTTRAPVQVPPDFSSWIISTNVTINYIDLIQKIVLSTPYVATPTTTMLQNPDGTVVPAAIPTAEFSEVIVFSRKVADDEAKQMEGYVAYRKNEQYLLDINHPYMPKIASLPFMNDLAAQIQDTEHSLKGELDTFDASVSNYRASLPTDPILEKAPPLKGKAQAALDQITGLRKNLTKGALLSRKKGTETTDSVFQSVNDLSLYTPPLTQDVYQKKLADYSGVLQELQAYVASLGTVDQVAARAVTQNNVSDQEQQLIAAHNVEELQATQLQIKMRQIYTDLRKRTNEMNDSGAIRYAALTADLTKQMSPISDAFEYHTKDINYRWNNLMATFSAVDKQISSGDWLAYVPSLDTSTVTTTTRGDAAFSIQYTDSYLNQLRVLYEQVRNQINEGDFAFVKGEIIYAARTMATFVKATVNPTCKKTFLPYFQNKYKQTEIYVKEFDAFYTVIEDAVKTLSKILTWNQKNKQAAKLDKKFPIAIVYSHLNSTHDRNVREVNKHDNSLTSIEYIITNPDGTILYEETEGNAPAAQFVFPSLELLSRHEQDMFFIKKTPYVDPSGNPIYVKYNILEPYAKSASILDALPETQVIARNFHIVKALYEIPRYTANCIYEFSIESPQPPILLPKYALPVGTFFTCVNVGRQALQIQIPGFPEDMIDTLGPSEICMYNYLGSVPNKSSYYGRRLWDMTRIAYDTLRDVPRSSKCAKITEFSKYVYMRTGTDPLFDKEGFLVEVEMDEGALGKVYDVDDVFKANPYSVTIGPDAHLSDLTIHPEWNEQMLIHPKFDELYVILEMATGLPVFCSSAGIPAIDEFGFCKYVMTPMLHIQDTIRIRGASTAPIEIQLNPDASLIQYGLISPIVSFNSIFRSNFVKPLGATYIFINSTGYPIVTPTRTYIQAENVTLQPPYLVFYTDSVKQVHAYIPKNPDPTITNATTLPVAPYHFIDITLKRDDLMDRRTGEILSYRFNLNTSYIQYTLAAIETKYDHYKKYEFDKTADVLKGLSKSSQEIKEYQSDFITYSANLTAIQSKQLISTTDKELKIAMDTLDLKMKEIIEKVFASFTGILNIIQVFAKIIDTIDSIKKSVKYLRDNIFIENEKSVYALQGIINGDKQAQGSPSSPELSSLLSQMVTLKVDFESRLKTLEGGVATMPKIFNQLDDWVTNQRMLIKKEYDVRRQIVQIETNSMVDLYTKRALNDSSSTLSEIQKVRAKADAYLNYKKLIALWLGVYPDMGQYAQDPLKPAIPSSPILKGYSIPFPVFEELSNPSFSRDWEGLLTTAKLSDALRSRVSLELILPIQAFIKNNSGFYINGDDTLSIPAAEVLATKTTDELKGVLADSKSKMDNNMANAIIAEAALQPIFEKYQRVRSDLRAEIQGVIQNQATQIQMIWTAISGQSTAIQTNLQILQPYLTPEQKGTAEKMVASVDGIMALDALQQVQGVLQSMKIPGFYNELSYMKMITLQAEREVLLGSLTPIQEKFEPVQDQLNSLQGDVLTNLKGSIGTSLMNMNASIVSAQATLSAAVGDNSALQTLQTTIRPEADALTAQPLNTVADCIGVMTKIDALNKRVQAMVGN